MTSVPLDFDNSIFKILFQIDCFFSNGAFWQASHAFSIKMILNRWWWWCT